MAYQCNKCNYKIEKEKLPNRCPYCSADGSIEKIKSAQTLLDDALDEMIVMDESKKERDESEFNF